VLAKVKGLDVASRTSSFQFKGREIGIPEIARKLSVRHVVEGSVRKAGSTVRITAQLIDTQTDRHLWSDTFDRPLTTDNIFTVQDEIARAIVKALDQAMGTQTRAQVTVAPVTDNLNAYELFLQARPLFVARHELDRADALLARAVELDPNFANAWEMRAAVQFLMHDYGYSSVARSEINRRAIELANRALAINPQGATSIAVLAKLQMYEVQHQPRRGDYHAIIKEFDRALSMSPRDASALIWRGQAYADVGNLSAALESFSRCLKFEPYSFPCQANQVNMLAALGKNEEALAAYEKSLDTGSVMKALSLPVLASTGQKNAFKTATNSPDFLFGWRRHDELYEAFRHPERTYPELVADILQFNRTKAKPTTEDDLSSLVIPLGALDRTADSVEVWNRAYANYRRSKQFKARVVNTGVLDYWRKHGFPPQCRAVGVDDFACD
jgi:tetratricopeptide (TPR) repeat protein